MVRRPLKVFLIVTIVTFLLGIISTTSQSQEWLGKVGGKFSWSKYLNGTDDFNWNAQLGADFEILRYGDSLLYLLVNMENVLEEGASWTDFPVHDINYVVEFGFKTDIQYGSLSFVLHHQCLHDVDRYDFLTPKWNVWGLRWASKVSTFSWLTSVGKYSERCNIDYDWDGVLELRADVLSYKGAVGSLLGNIHGVIQDDERPSGRSYFVDYTIEPAIKFRSQGGIFIIFYQFQHRHDIDKCNGETEDWSILGFRYEW